MLQQRCLVDADGFEIVADPLLVAGLLRHVPVQEVAQLPMRVRHPAGRGCADRVEVPDNLIELEQQLAIAFDRKSVGDRRERHGMRLEVAPRLVRALDQRHEEITHLSDAVLCCAGRMQRVPSFNRPVSQRRTIPANSVEPRGAESMAVNLSKPDATSVHPVAGVTIGTAMAGVRKANRRDVTVVLARAGRRGRRRLHRQPVLRRAGAALPRAPRRRRRRCARSSSIPAMPTPAPAPTGWRGRARPVRRSAALLGCAPRAGAAVFHRRDHGDAAERAHRGRRCRPRSPMRGPMAGHTPPRRS